MSSPALDWDGCLNTRDVGGLPVADGGRVRTNALIRSDSLGYLTPSGVEAVRRHGLSAIIDLRYPGEGSSATSPAVPHPFAEDEVYRLIPMFVPGDQNLDPVLLATASTGEIYCAMADHHAERIAAAVAAIAASPPGPVVVHCADGKDRTGLVTALVLAVAGVSRTDIAADYAASEQRLAGRLETLLAAEPDPQIQELIQNHWATAPESMLTFLKHIDERFGGAAPYLHTNGMDAVGLCALRDRIVAPG